MTTFTGTIQEFYKYFGLRIKNIIIASDRQFVGEGVCGLCGKWSSYLWDVIDEDKYREKIKQVLSRYTDENMLISCEIEVVEDEMTKVAWWIGACMSCSRLQDFYGSNIKHSDPVDRLLSRFGSFDKPYRSCRKIFCEVCGGLSYAIKSNMTEELDNEIKSTLSGMSFESFVALSAGDGGWSWFFHKNWAKEVRLIFKRKEDSIDSSDLNQLDKYVFDARHYMRGCSSYENLLDLAERRAIETANESLIESLAIIFGSEILKDDHKEFLDLAIELAIYQSKPNKKIHRVLYNNLRVEFPEIRGYIGDGNSVPPYY